MAKHRQGDRNRGLTGETDPHKIKAMLGNIEAKEVRERDRVIRENAERQAKKNKG